MVVIRGTHGYQEGVAKSGPYLFVGESENKRTKEGRKQ